jgi:hypothetical protein
MNKQKWLVVAMTALVMLMSSACGSTGDAKPTNEVVQSPTASPANAPAAGGNSENLDEQILILIDQTPKPVATGHSFDFFVKQLPEGYSLSEMQWISDKNQITNTYLEAIEHGGNGEDGFYISGNGQFSGFFYPDSMVGETGKVKFIFKNDSGKELTWEKEITLK